MYVAETCGKPSQATERITSCEDENQNVYGTHIRIWSGVADSGDCWSTGVAAATVG